MNALEILNAVNKIAAQMDDVAKDFEPAGFIKALAANALHGILQMALDMGPPPDLATSLNISPEQAKDLYEVVLRSALRRKV